MTLVDIVRHLEQIKERLPKFQQFPEVTDSLKKTRESLELEFLDELQILRLKDGYSERYTAYNNWYKNYKGIEQL